MTESAELEVDVYLHLMRPQPGTRALGCRRDCCRKTVDDKGVRRRSRVRGGMT